MAETHALKGQKRKKNALKRQKRKQNALKGQKLLAQGNRPGL